MLLRIITYYWVSLHIWVLQLDFIAGDVRALYIYNLQASPDHQSLQSQ